MKKTGLRMQSITLSNLKLTDKQHKILSDKIENHFGIHFDFNKKIDLERILKEAFWDHQGSDWEEFVDSLVNKEFNKDIIYWLAPYITIGETYFFRENQSLEILVNQIIPDLLSKGKEAINIWSAACSSGEEPYSIAIMLLEKYAKFPEQVKIYATDINKESLSIAKQGIYRNWSFRNTPRNLREKYFTSDSNNYFRLSDEVKEKVEFHHLNLNDNYHGIFKKEAFFDIILLRNTLIYFSQKAIDRLLDKIRSSLAEGGYYIPGYAELRLINKDGLKPVYFNRIHFYQKQSDYKKNQDILSLKFETKNNTIKKYRIQNNEKKKKDLSRIIKQEKKEQNKKIEKENRSIEFSIEDVRKLFTNADYNGVINLIDRAKKEQQLNTLSNDIINEINLLYCKAYANKGDIKKSIEICKQLLNTNKLNSRLHELAAQLFVEIGNYENALSHLNTAIFIEPNAPLLYFLRANINDKLSDYKEARYDLAHVIKLLSNIEPDRVLEEADGLTAERLKDIARVLLENLN